MRGGEYILDLNKINEKEKGYLFGIFEGDGYSMYNKKDRHYHVEFYLNSKTNLEIIEFLCRLLRKLGTNPLFMKDKRFECMRIRVNSKNLFNWINQSFEKNLKNKEFALGFVSGFLDAEGYVNPKHSTLNIVNTDFEIMKTISKILKINRIPYRLSLKKALKNNWQKIYILHISVSFKRLSHLSIKAGKL
jgi:hypothetical protein